jgi:hypothetical protein
MYNKKLMSNRRLIVSFTTTPDRVDYLEPVINNILTEQTVKPDLLVLYLPHKYLKNGKEYSIPEYLENLTKKYLNFIIRRVDDIGPITKVYYALLQFNRPKDLIISIDDDILLEQHAIEELLDAHKSKPYSILGFMGCNNDGFVHAENIQLNNKGRNFVNVKGLGGYRSILFPRILISDDYFEHFNNLNILHLNTIYIPLLEDDNYTSIYFNHKNISMYVISTYFPGDLSSNDIRKRINIKFLDSSNYGALYGTGDHSNISKSYEIIVNYFNSLKTS